MNILSDISAAMHSHGFYCPSTINLGGKIVSIKNPVVMGVINVSMDSFYSGSAFQDQETILNRVAEMMEEGAEVIDMGAASTRPGAKAVSESEEIKRLSFGLEAIRKNFPEIPISVDTYNLNVLKAVAHFSIQMVNDISGGSDAMYEWIAENQLPYILMHMKGNPETMKSIT